MTGLPPFLDQLKEVEPDSNTAWSAFYGLIWLLLVALCTGFVAGALLSAVAILIWVLGK